MEITIEGVIGRICKPQEWPSGFRKCEVHVVVENGKYPDTIPVEFIKDDVDEAIGLTVGAPIKVQCYVQGREWTSETGALKVFVSFVMNKYELPEGKSIRETVIEQSKNNEPKADDMPW